MEQIIKKIMVLVGFLSLTSFGEKNTINTYSLTIKVKHLRNTIGVVQFAIYNKDGSIPDEKYKRYYKKKVVPITKDSSTVVFTNLPEGKYAINILHDENENGKIDKEFILPKEGIGFSNYKSIGIRNRPKFSKASFLLNSDTVKEIKVIYF
ncbi:hypothetical protein Lupro_09310 [Lutibacter profundi]|uniref:DUF2141 domain-containing protein n=1 Tax=Lutibacter profundi TaxID=1622118 RepID=A0A0X8G7G3_9FLAO|nr:DUF2141 domain-containing protein [Lutibacter profundi]AMC11450.1 hypothetical protein Lupro_09310 [Lutibacter profundi]